MTNMTKVLIGFGVVGAVAAATYFVTKTTEEKTTVVARVDENGETKVEEIKEESILEQIKKAATKKVIRILAWVALHQQQIEAIGTIIGLGAGIFNIINAIKEYRAGNKMREQINELVTFKDEFYASWNDYKDATNHNVQWFEQKLNDIHLDMSYFHEQVENLPKKVTKKTA